MTPLHEINLLFWYQTDIFNTAYVKALNLTWPWSSFIHIFLSPYDISLSWLIKGPLSKKFTHQSYICIFDLPISATRPDHRDLWLLWYLTCLSHEALLYAVSWTYRFITLSTNILVSILFQSASSLCPSLKMRGEHLQTIHTTIIWCITFAHMLMPYQM
jgi:hypothetical protein